MRASVPAWSLSLGLAASVAAGSCAPIGPFACTDDDQCRDAGVAGQCSVGFCSYPDDACPSGQRYSEHATADLANDCVSVAGTSSEATTAAETSGGMASSDGVAGTEGGTTTTETSGSDTGAPLCGNGDLDPGEECDDGNDQDGDECTASCLVAGAIRWQLTVDMPQSQSAVAYGLAARADDRLTVVGGAGEAMNEVMFFATCSVGETRCTAETRDGGASGATTAFGVATLSDDGFWVGGRERPTNDPQGERAWAGRFDPAGVLIDSEQFNLGEDDVVFGVGVDATDGLTVAGGTGSVAWIERRDGAGALDWVQEYDGEGQGATARAIVVGSAGGALVVGVQTDAGARTDGWLLRLSAAGGASTPVVIGAPGQDEAAHGVAALANSDAVVVGQADGDGWVGRYPVGATMASATDTLPAGGSLAAVTVAGNGDIVVVGHVGAEGRRAAWVARYGDDLQPQWSRTHPLDGDTALHAVAFGRDGGLFAAGETNESGTRRAVVVEMTP